MDYSCMKRASKAGAGPVILVCCGFNYESVAPNARNAARRFLRCAACRAWAKLGKAASRRAPPPCTSIQMVQALNPCDPEPACKHCQFLCRVHPKFPNFGEMTLNNWRLFPPLTKPHEKP